MFFMYIVNVTTKCRHEIKCYMLFILYKANKKLNQVWMGHCKFLPRTPTVIDPDPGKGVCADPVNKSAIFEGEGPGPPSGDKERVEPRQGKRKDVTEWGDVRRSRKTTPSWLQDASMHRVSSRAWLKKKVCKYIGDTVLIVSIVSGK